MSTSTAPIENTDLLKDYFSLPAKPKITVRARSTRTNTFDHLETLCRVKGIACER